MSYDPFGVATDPAYTDTVDPGGIPAPAEPRFVRSSGGGTRTFGVDAGEGADPVGSTLLSRIFNSSRQTTSKHGYYDPRLGTYVPPGSPINVKGADTGGDYVGGDSTIGWYQDPNTGEWIRVTPNGIRSTGADFPANLTQREAEEWVSRVPGVVGFPTGENGELLDITETGSGSGSGSGSGRAAPQFLAPNYMPPPEEQVRDQVKAYVVATTGTARKELIDQGVREYLAADRANYDAQVTAERGRVLNQTVSTITSTDPWSAVKTAVQGSSAYKVIHNLRPESVDEMEWVTSRQGKLRQLGLSAEQSERLGIMQSQAGSNDEAIVDAAEMQFNADTGRLLSSQRDSLKRKASAVLGLV